MVRALLCGVAREREQLDAIEFEALGPGLSVGIAQPWLSGIAAILSVDAEWSNDYGCSWQPCVLGELYPAKSKKIWFRAGSAENSSFAIPTGARYDYNGSDAVWNWNNATQTPYACVYFKSAGQLCRVSGDPRCMLSRDFHEMQLSSRALQGMFYGLTSLTDASGIDLQLSGSNMPTWCFAGMLMDCVNYLKKIEMLQGEGRWLLASPMLADVGVRPERERERAVH